MKIKTILQFVYYFDILVLLFNFDIGLNNLFFVEDCFDAVDELPWLKIRQKIKLQLDGTKCIDNFISFFILNIRHEVQ